MGTRRLIGGLAPLVGAIGLGLLLGSSLGGRTVQTTAAVTTPHLVAFVPDPGSETPSGSTYGSGWYVYSDGGVGAAEDAGNYGDLPLRDVHVTDIVTLLPTLDERGYWLIGADGGVFAFGDARYRGSVPGLGERVSDVVGADHCFGGGYELISERAAWDFGCDQDGYWP